METVVENENWKSGEKTSQFRQLKIDHSKLLDDQAIRRWYSNNRKGSRMRADIYLRSLSRFCFGYAKMNLGELVRLSVEEMENLLMDFVDYMEAAENPKSGKKYAPGYIESYVKSVKS